jgi:hypothetical protein
MMPHDADPFERAEENLLASPGARVMDVATGRQFRVGTLVPAKKADGSCIHLGEDGKCAIRAVAPFGCAFFDCGPNPRFDLSLQAR